MTGGDAWLDYFHANRERPLARVARFGGELDPRLRDALVRSLGRFYLGESSEGRIVQEAARSRDPALDPAMKECIALYVREEGKHAREIASALGALGAPLPERHWSEVAFRRARRLLGVRTKMMTIGAAEVVGVVYYGLLAEHVAPLAELGRTIARDEREHLDFQAAYFARVLAGDGARGALRRAIGAAGYGAIVTCAIATFVIDHAPLLRALGVTRAEITRRCVREAMRGARRCVAARRERERDRGAPDPAKPSGTTSSRRASSPPRDRATPILAR